MLKIHQTNSRIKTRTTSKSLTSSSCPQTAQGRSQDFALGPVVKVQT